MFLRLWHVLLSLPSSLYLVCCTMIGVICIPLVFKVAPELSWCFCLYIYILQLSLKVKSLELKVLKTVLKLWFWKLLFSVFCRKQISRKTSDLERVSSKKITWIMSFGVLISVQKSKFSATFTIDFFNKVFLDLTHLPLLFWHHSVASNFKWTMSQVCVAFLEYLNLHKIKFDQSNN